MSTITPQQTTACMHTIDDQGQCTSCNMLIVNTDLALPECTNALWEDSNGRVRCTAHLAHWGSADFEPLDADEVGFRFEVTGNELRCDRDWRAVAW